MTWLVVLARQRASPLQLAELTKHYGRPDSVQLVKQLYYDMKIDKVSHKFEN